VKPIAGKNRLIYGKVKSESRKNPGPKKPGTALYKRKKGFGI